MMRTVNNINDKARRHDEQLTAKSCPMSTTYLEVLRWGEAQSCHPVRPICRYFSVFWQFGCQEDPGHSMHLMPKHRDPLWARHPQDPPTRTLACRRVTSLCRSRIHRRKWGRVAVRDSVMLFGSEGNKKQEVTSAFTQGHSSRQPTGQLPSLSAALLDHAHGWIPGQLESFWLVDPGLHCERQ